MAYGFESKLDLLRQPSAHPDIRLFPIEALSEILTAHNVPNYKPYVPVVFAELFRRLYYAPADAMRKKILEELLSMAEETSLRNCIDAIRRKEEQLGDERVVAGDGEIPLELPSVLAGAVRDSFARQFSYDGFIPVYGKFDKMAHLIPFSFVESENRLDGTIRILNEDNKEIEDSQGTWTGRIASVGKMISPPISMDVIVHTRAKLKDDSFQLPILMAWLRRCGKIAYNPGRVFSTGKFEHCKLVPVVVEPKRVFVQNSIDGGMLICPGLSGLNEINVGDSVSEIVVRLKEILHMDITTLAEFIDESFGPSRLVERIIDIYRREKLPDSICFLPFIGDGGDKKCKVLRKQLITVLSSMLNSSCGGIIVIGMIVTDESLEMPVPAVQLFAHKDRVQESECESGLNFEERDSGRDLEDWVSSILGSMHATSEFEDEQGDRWHLRRDVISGKDVKSIKCKYMGRPVLVCLIKPSEVPVELMQQCRWESANGVREICSRHIYKALGRHEWSAEALVREWHRGSKEKMSEEIGEELRTERKLFISYNENVERIRTCTINWLSRYFDCSKEEFWRVKDCFTWHGQGVVCIGGDDAGLLNETVRRMILGTMYTRAIGSPIPLYVEYPASFDEMDEAESELPLHRFYRGLSMQYNLPYDMEEEKVGELIQSKLAFPVINVAAHLRFPDTVYRMIKDMQDSRELSTSIFVVGRLPEKPHPFSVRTIRLNTKKERF